MLIYGITAGNVGGAFVIGGLTGQLTVNTPPGLDFETRAQFTLTVEVKDRRGLTASAPVTVYVNDLNDPPIIAFPIPDQQTQANRPFTFTFDADAFQDPDDGDVLTFTGTGAAGSPLPAWLSFEPSTRTFSGTPTCCRKSCPTLPVRGSLGRDTMNRELQRKRLPIPCCNDGDSYCACSCASR